MPVSLVLDFDVEQNGEKKRQFDVRFSEELMNVEEIQLEGYSIWADEGLSTGAPEQPYITVDFGSSLPGLNPSVITALGSQAADAEYKATGSEKGLVLPISGAPYMHRFVEAPDRYKYCMFRASSKGTLVRQAKIRISGPANTAPAVERLTLYLRVLQRVGEEAPPYRRQALFDKYATETASMLQGYRTPLQ